MEQGAARPAALLQSTRDPAMGLADEAPPYRHARGETDQHTRTRGLPPMMVLAAMAGRC